MEVKGDNVDEEMKEDVDSVRGLLDRLKQEKESELQKYGSHSVQENGISISDSKEDNVINELQKNQASLVMNLKSVVRTKEPSTKSSQEDGTTQNDTGDNSKKRKQNLFLVEVQERAEVISKSARKGPETLVSSIAQTAEEDPDTEEFLRKIRAAPSASTEEQVEDTETRPYRSKSASEVDLSVVLSSFSQLNLELQKSKIALGRSGSLKGRRKPSVSMRRKNLKSSFTGDWDDPDAISEGDESMDEEEIDVGLSGAGSFIIKDPPQAGAGSEVRPRSKPKLKVKSQTVAGIALPGLAEVLKTKNISMGNVRPQASAAEIVRAAAEGKKKQAAKEERVEKEPEKPAWLVEAETRRKLHERRRHTKGKQHEEMDQAQDKPLNGVVLRPVAQRSEPLVGNSDINGVALRPVAHRNEPVVGKSDSPSPGGKKLHNVMLRPVRKPDPVPSKSEEDNDVSRTALNICLRPVSKPEPVAKQPEGESDNIRARNVFLRPLPKSEPLVNSDNAVDSHGMFQHVRLKPIVYPMGPRSSGSKVTETEVTPITNRTSSDVPTETEPGPLEIRTSSEVPTSNSPPLRTVGQSLSHPGSLRVYENGETSSDVAGTTKTSPEHRIGPSLTPTTSEKPTTIRSEPKIIGGSRVTVSSNYVSAPHKMAPKTKPKPSNRSKTVTVTASEVPDPCTVRRKSVEMIHAKVEWKGSRNSSSAVSHNTKSDPRAPRKISDHRDRTDMFDTAYKPTYTGDVLPQWKIDLMERKKNVAALPDRPQPTQISNSVVVPLWKKELAEKRKQRVELNSVQTLNKENELKTSPEIPQWKKELAERKTRRTQPIVIPEDPADQVPSFMREFEKKKRTFPRGGNNASYV